MRRFCFAAGASVALACILPCAVTAATLHGPDAQAPASYEKQPDGSWVVHVGQSTVTLSAAEASTFADQVKANPPDPAPASSSAPPTALFADGLTTNCTKAAFWNHADLGVSENPNWFCESGDNIGGHVVEGMFRQWSRRRDLANYRAQLDLKLNAFNTLRADAVAGWNGVKLWMHRGLQAPGPGGRIDDGFTSGYTAEVALRDGKVYIQKKVGDVYCLLSTTPSFPYPLAEWHRVGGEVRNNADGTVTITVLRDGRSLVSVKDSGQCNGPPLRGPGRLGIRGDNIDMNVRDMVVDAL